MRARVCSYWLCAMVPGQCRGGTACNAHREKLEELVCLERAHPIVIEGRKRRPQHRAGPAEVEPLAHRAQKLLARHIKVARVRQPAGRRRPPRSAAAPRRGRVGVIEQLDSIRDADLLRAQLLTKLRAERRGISRIQPDRVQPTRQAIGAHGRLLIVVFPGRRHQKELRLGGALCEDCPRSRAA